MLLSFPSSLLTTTYSFMGDYNMRYKPPPPGLFPKKNTKKEMISPHSHYNFLDYCPKNYWKVKSMKVWKIHFDDMKPIYMLS